MAAADIGARGGVDTDLLAIAPAVTVIAFEPEPDEAQRLCGSNVGSWRAVQYVNAAIGGIVGKGTLFLPPAKAGASLLRHNPIMIEAFGNESLHGSAGTIEVDVTTLHQLRQEDQIPRIDYLKVDVEGAELAILQAAASLLPELSAMKVEVSFLEQRIAQPLVWDVVNFVRQNGFEVIDLLDVHRWRRRPVPAHPFRTAFEMPYSRGQVSQVDVICLAQITSEHSIDFCHRQIIIASGLGYFDYAVSVLRRRPDAKLAWTERHGFDLETALAEASRRRGLQVAWKELGASVRCLIPRLRSALGVLPYREPTSEY